MKELRFIIVVLCALSVGLCWMLINDYEEIDSYNQVANSYRWISDLGSNTEYVEFVGDEERHYIKAYTNKGNGMIDKNGNEILPYKFYDAEYKGGDYMAAATNDKWLLMDLNGKEASSFNRISYVYSYAGDKYFIKYGDDAFEDLDDGFSIIDAVSGETVKEYNDYYNAVRLDDGNWYISKTFDKDEGIAARMILMQRGTYSTDFPEEVVESRGFFVNEDFETLYGGKEFRLICQDDGIYVVKDIGVGGQDQYVVLDENGELFKVNDEKLSKRIRNYEKKGNLANNDTITVFRGEGDSIGFSSIDNIYDVIYYDYDGKLIDSTKIDKNSYSVENEDWIIFTEPEKDEYFTTIKYGIKDKNDNVILPAAYYDLRFLPGTENIMVNSSMGCGIIRLGVN